MTTNWRPSPKSPTGLRRICEWKRNSDGWAGNSGGVFGSKRKTRWWGLGVFNYVDYFLVIVMKRLLSFAWLVTWTATWVQVFGGDQVTYYGRREFCSKSEASQFLAQCRDCTKTDPSETVCCERKKIVEIEKGERVCY